MYRGLKFSSFGDVLHPKAHKARTAAVNAAEIQLPMESIDNAGAPSCFRCDAKIGIHLVTNPTLLAANHSQ